MTLRRAPSQFLARLGTATLVAGTRTDLSGECLTAPDRCTILLSRNTPGGTLGNLYAPSSSRGPTDVTFDVVSSDGADVSSFNFMCIPKNPGIKSAQLSSTSFPADGSLRRPPSGLFIARGTATLVAGTVTVTTGKQFTAEARVFVMANTLAGTPGFLSAPGASVNPATGQFVINSDSALDTSTVDWVLVDSQLRFSPSGPRMGQANGTLSAGLATVEGINPMSSVDISVIASRITLAGVNGQMSAPTRAPGVTIGSIGISGGNVGDISTFEVAVF